MRKHALVCRYPAGYSLIFIPYYSPAYSGYHWGVYDQSNNFYGFDDGDTTAGENLNSHAHLTFLNARLDITPG